MPTRFFRSPAVGIALILAASRLYAGLLEGAASLLDAGGHRLVATSETPDVDESSGVIASRLEPDVYWTHNDSGGLPRVYAFRLNAADRARRVARDLGYVELANARNGDWEDIAYGPGGMIYVFDGGADSPYGGSNKCIYRFREPKLDPGGGPVRSSVKCECLRFDYPDPRNAVRPASRDQDRYDAESFFVHPATGDMYVVTKRGEHKIPRALVYKIEARGAQWDGRTEHVLRFVADLSLVVPAMATGADIDDAGRHVVIRDYLSAYEFTLPEGRPFDSIFSTTPQAARLLGELQGEAICYTRDGNEFITTSEVQVVRKRQFPVYATPAPSATTRPASAPSR